MKKPGLKVLMITHHRRQRIVARSFLIGKHLVRRGHQVTIVTIADTRRIRNSDYFFEGVHLVETPDLLWGRLRSGWDIWNIINRLYYLSQDSAPYDLIHCFETRPATIYPALFMVSKKKIPWLTDWNDWFGRGGLITINRPRWYRFFLGWLETYYEEAFRARAQGLTVISTALLERAIRLGVDGSRICYLPGGADTEQFPYHTIQECRNQLNLPISDPIIGFSSGDSHLNLEIIMQALAFVAQEYPSIKLLVTGEASENVRRMAQEYQVSDRIIWTGFLPLESLSVYLGCANLFVLPFPPTPYNIGRWPNKVGDYLCLGRPIVSNAVGDIKNLFNNYSVGLLAEWDPRDFACQILTILNQPELAMRFGENAVQAAFGPYNWNRLIDRLEDFYYTILQMNHVDVKKQKQQ